MWDVHDLGHNTLDEKAEEDHLVLCGILFLYYLLRKGFEGTRRIWHATTHLCPGSL
jgi:hypothetical protein